VVFRIILDLGTKAQTLEADGRRIRPWQVEMARATDKAVISKLYPNAKDISQPEPKE
jgi:hypothetical protein